MIRVIGMGTGLPAPHIGEAALVVGAERHLAAVAVPPGAERVVLGALEPALERIAAHCAGEVSRGGSPLGDIPRPPGGRAPSRLSPDTDTPAGCPQATGAGGIVVLASGDPGFFGIVRVLAERFGSGALDIRPAAPSVAVAFARAGLPWDDALVVSAHGRDLRTAVNVCRAHPKTAVLTGPGAGPAELGAALARTNRTLVVAEALGTPAERLHRLTPAEAAARDWSAGPVNVVLCLDEARSLSPAPRTIAGRPERPRQWALPEDAFAHRDSMITKFEVRALALARLAPGPGDLVWDVGAGSGSVAVECARLGAAVIALEQSPAGADLVRRNATAHGVDVEAVTGRAPDALAVLPDPDAVFVGGGGADLPAITAVAARRARRAVVVTLAALDRVPAVREALAAGGLAVDGVQLQSSRLAPLPGGVTRLAATNPVFVLWGVRDPDDFTPHSPGAGPTAPPPHQGAPT
ncbi:precorrin-6y C5,15-methyltransferase (decarboxylating) subunit CbiE [Streptomyces sp. NPDC051940]|uniref:precorrin-6y C5,15-methyltransferase (decarboxylating) subunit CbiE n=1 Tax=Streptomyces sp. NPDC051940 TaxID=3155675 RepID=UPI003429FFE5